MENQRYRKNGIDISRVGLGCMRMSINPRSKRSESISTIHAALDSGINLINTGDFYGIAGHNEKLIAEALKGRKREQAFISLKYGSFFNPLKGFNKVDVGPQNMKKYFKNSLKRLNLDYIDLYQPARIDVGIPIEETIGAISDLVKDGYVKHIGVSEVDADTLRKAHAVHPISLAEFDVSITNNSIDTEILPTARELGIGIVGFGILSSGKLFKKEGNSLIDMIKKIAGEKNITISQLAHAWVLAKGDDIIPLIGARTVSQLEDSMQCLDVNLDDADILRLTNAMKASRIMGPMMPKMTIKNGIIIR